MSESVLKMILLYTTKVHKNFCHCFFSLFFTNTNSSILGIHIFLSYLQTTIENTVLYLFFDGCSFHKGLMLFYSSYTALILKLNSPKTFCHNMRYNRQFMFSYHIKIPFIIIFTNTLRNIVNLLIFL